MWHILLRAVFNILKVQHVVTAKDSARGKKQMKGKQGVHFNITCVRTLTELTA